MTSPVLVDLRGNVAHLVLNRPDAANSIDTELAAALRTAVIRCDENPEVRAILLSGRGPMFSAGGDVKAFAALDDDDLAVYLKELTTDLHAAISRLVRGDAPVVAAVHGVAAGAGMSLAFACDFVVAGDRTRFKSAYTDIGLSPDGSSTYVVPRLVGLRRAVELALTNRMLTAAEAKDWGLVNEVVPEEEVLDRAAALAASLAAGPTLALGAAKRLLHDGWTDSLESHMERETRTIASMARTRDGREGLEAFVAKRPPKFTGC